MNLDSLKIPFKSNNYLIFLLVGFIALGFGNASESFMGIMKKPEVGKSCGRKCSRKNSFSDNEGIKGLLGGNAFFIVAVVALLFLCGDDKDNIRSIEEAEED